MMHVVFQYKFSELISKPTYLADYTQNVNLIYIFQQAPAV